MEIECVYHNGNAKKYLVQHNLISFLVCEYLGDYDIIFKQPYAYGPDYKIKANNLNDAIDEAILHIRNIVKAYEADSKKMVIESLGCENWVEEFNL